MYIQWRAKHSDSAWIGRQAGHSGAHYTRCAIVMLMVRVPPAKLNNMFLVIYNSLHGRTVSCKLPLPKRVHTYTSCGVGVATVPSAGVHAATSWQTPVVASIDSTFSSGGLQSLNAINLSYKVGTDFVGPSGKGISFPVICVTRWFRLCTPVLNGPWQRPST